jgi:hypothetical protein
MSSAEQFTRAMLTIRSAFGTAAAWDFWSRMGVKWMEDALASGDAKKIETEMLSQFAAAWKEAAGKAKTAKAKVAAKKDGFKVNSFCGLRATLYATAGWHFAYASYDTELARTVLGSMLDAVLSSQLA